MAVEYLTPDPFICPLCGQSNACLNLGDADINQTCWCNDPTLRFPKALLEQIPAQLRGRACICRACVLQFQANATPDPSDN